LNDCSPVIFGLEGRGGMVDEPVRHVYFVVCLLPSGVFTLSRTVELMMDRTMGET
jgi:hypothetical protein